MRLVFAAFALVAMLTADARAAAKLDCVGNPTTGQPLTLSVDGENATGRYVAPYAPPRVAVIMGHGYSFASDGWDVHGRRLALESGALAITMDYRGLVVLGDDAEDEWPYRRSRGYPVKTGSEDLVAAGQAAVARCPSVRHVILLGTSMGGNASGMAAALGARRPDGSPLFDYWIGIEGVYNLLELYELANVGGALSEFVARVREDIEEEAGGTPQQKPAEYAERTVVGRVDDIAAAGLKGVALVHARQDGLALYPQAQEMSALLRERGVPTDFYTVGTRAEGDDPDTTIASYFGQQTDQAGHGPEVSENHIVIDTGFERAAALIAGEPPPCGRDFAVEGKPRGVSPDPATTCPAGERLAPRPCRVGAPKVSALRARAAGEDVLVSGRIRPGTCARRYAQLSVRVNAAPAKPVRAGRFRVRLRGAAGVDRVTFLAEDRGSFGPRRRVRVS